VKETAKSHITFVMIAAIARPLLNLMMNKKWEGTEKLPAGGFIAAPNHCTEIDPIVIGHLLYNQTRAPHFLAKAGLFRVPVLGSLLRAVKQIPVERSTAGANRSLQLAKEIVAEGGAIVIYPEGTLTRDPDLWPMKGKTGAARIALRTGCPVIPIGQWGAQELMYGKKVQGTIRSSIVLDAEGRIASIHRNVRSAGNAGQGHDQCSISRCLPTPC
jgi:1-acyl-sn-glycerol-3-phosphate acyltransferase